MMRFKEHEYEQKLTRVELLQEKQRQGTLTAEEISDKDMIDLI